MATKADVQIHLFTNGDVQLDQLVNCATNQNSPAVVDRVMLRGGLTIQIQQPIPLSGAFNPTGVLIVLPPSNTFPITLKGTTADLGIKIHPTNPSFLSTSPPNPIALFLDAPVGETLDIIMIWV